MIESNYEEVHISSKCLMKLITLKENNRRSSNKAFEKDFFVSTMNNPGLKKGIDSLGLDSFQWPKLDTEEKTAILRKEKGRGSFCVLTS